MDQEPLYDHEARHFEPSYLENLRSFFPAKEWLQPEAEDEEDEGEENRFNPFGYPSRPRRKRPPGFEVATPIFSGVYSLYRDESSEVSDEVSDDSSTP